MEKQIKKDAFDLLLDEWENTINTILEPLNIVPESLPKFCTEWKSAQATYCYFEKELETTSLLVSGIYNKLYRQQTIKQKQDKRYINLRNKKELINKGLEIHEMINKPA